MGWPYASWNAHGHPCHICVCVCGMCMLIFTWAHKARWQEFLRLRLRFFQFRACALGVWTSAFTLLSTFLARLFAWILFHRKISRCWRGACTSWSLHTFKHMVIWVKIATCNYVGSHQSFLAFLRTIPLKLIKCSLQTKLTSWTNSKPYNARSIELHYKIDAWCLPKSVAIDLDRLECPLVKHDQPHDASSTSQTRF